MCHKQNKVNIGVNNVFLFFQVCTVDVPSVQVKKSYIIILSHYHETHDDVIKWKHFLRYWPFVRGIHRSPVNTPHKGQWRGALMFSLIRRLNTRLSKLWQWWGWWFEMPLRPLWHHCNVLCFRLQYWISPPHPFNFDITSFVVKTVECSCNISIITWCCMRHDNGKYIKQIRISTHTIRLHVQAIGCYLWMVWGKWLYENANGNLGLVSI